MSDISKKPQQQSVRMYVRDDFKLPQWFKSASPDEVSNALSITAGLMPVLRGEVPPGLRVQQQISEAVAKSQLAHESALQSLMTEMKQHLSDTRSMMQTRINELTEAKNKALSQYNSLKEETEAEMSRLKAEVESCKEKEFVSTEDQSTVQAHFKGLVGHAADVFSLLADQNEVIKQLSDNLTQIRAKEMVWYRSAKQTNKAIPWSSVEMQLPFESAYEHAIGRTWNNMTASKLKDLEAALGKEAASLSISKEKVGIVEKLQRME
jgi:YesN/AraC family two-component response regulator